MPQQAGFGPQMMTDSLPGLFEGTEMPTAGWWEALWPDAAKVLHAIGLVPGMDVVDLCSGDGWFTLRSTTGMNCMNPLPISFRNS